MLVILISNKLPQSFSTSLHEAACFEHHTQFEYLWSFEFFKYM